VFKPAWRKWKIAGACAVIALACGLLVRERETTRLTVLPLAGGHAVFCDSPGSRSDLLVDSGNENSVEFVMTPFLRAHGVNTLPGLVLTDGHVRNVGGAERIQELFRVSEVVTSPVRFRSAAYKRVVDDLDRTP